MLFAFNDHTFPVSDDTLTKIHLINVVLRLPANKLFSVLITNGKIFSSCLGFDLKVSCMFLVSALKNLVRFNFGQFCGATLL